MEWSRITEHPDLLLMLLAPIFLLCIAAEYWIGQRGGKLHESARYYLPEVVCNFVLASLHQATDILTGLLIAKLYLWWFGWRLFDIEMTVSTFLLFNGLARLFLLLVPPSKSSYPLDVGGTRGAPQFRAHELQYRISSKPDVPIGRHVVVLGATGHYWF